VVDNKNNMASHGSNDHDYAVNTCHNPFTPYDRNENGFGEQSESQSHYTFPNTMNGGFPPSSGHQQAKSPPKLELGDLNASSNGKVLFNQDPNSLRGTDNFTMNPTDPINHAEKNRPRLRTESNQSHYGEVAHPWKPTHRVRHDVRDRIL
jgi:hypothetical protein